METKIQQCVGAKWFKAAKRGDLNTLSAMACPALLELGDNFGKRALHHAADKGWEPMMDFLIRAGVDVAAKSNLGRNAAICAAYAGRAACLEMLIAAGCPDEQSDNSYGSTAVMSAAHKGNIDCLRLLIDAGWSLDAQDSYGHSAASLAMTWKHLDCLKILVAAGCDPEVSDKKGFTLAIRAALNGQAECLALLIGTGADLDAVDAEGRSAAMLAAGNGRVECLRLLIEAGFDMDYKPSFGSYEGKTALDVALRENNRAASFLQAVYDARQLAGSMGGEIPPASSKSRQARI